MLDGFNVVKIMSDFCVNVDNTGRYNKDNKNNNYSSIGTKTNNIIKPMTIYGIFKNNRLFGRCVIVYQGYIYTCNTKIT